MGSKDRRTVAATAAWDEQGALVIRVPCLETTSDYTFTLIFDEDHLILKRTTPIDFHFSQYNIEVDAYRKGSDAIFVK